MEVMTFKATTDWVLTHGYFLMFLGMMLWGPPVTAAGAFGAALNYFDIWIVFALSLGSNLLTDVVYYAVGYWGREEIIAKYGKYVGITNPRLRVSQKLLTENIGKAMLIAKLVPLLALPGLIMAGIVKVPLRPFIWWALVIALPSTLVYLALGYYFGAIYDTVEQYVHLGGAVIVALVLLFMAGAHYTRRVSKKMEREHTE